MPVAAYGQGCGPTNPNCIVPTAAPGTNNNQAASTAFVQQAISNTSGPITVPATVSWFANDTPPANISMINDRLFLGDAVKYLATTPVAGATGNDWFTLYECSTSNGCPSYLPWATLAVETSTTNSNSWQPFLAASQSLHCPAAGCTAIAVSAFAINNSTNNAPTFFYGGWAYYGECNQTTTATSYGREFCVGVEIEVSTTINNASPASGNPDPFSTGIYTGIEIGCGSGMGTPTKFPCSQALGIEANAQPWNAGIIFQNGGIATTTGTLGTFPVAIAFPAGYALIWYTAAGTQKAGFDFDAAGQLNLGVVSIAANGNVGVTCTAGTVNAATLTTYLGIVTHC